MIKHVRLFLQSAVILVTLQISAQAQPAFVADVPNDSRNFQKIGNLVFFTSGNSLWRTDGTTEGTMLLKSGFVTVPNSFRELNEMLIFTTSASELWRSDGTPSGTILLTTASSIGLQQSTGNLLFFTASDAATGQELYRTDGTPGGTFLIKDIFPGSGAGFRGRNAVVGNYLFFNGDDGTHGFELWKTDGTSGGTVMVKDILPGPGHGYGGNANAFAHNNLFYFSGNTVEYGMEPWVSNGTEAGTRLLSDTEPGAEDPQQIQFAIANEEVVYFITHADKSDAGYVRGESNLWKTDGTSASTGRVATLAEADYEFAWFRVFRGKIFFFGWVEYDVWGAIDSHLYATDGTEAGTSIIYSLTTHEGSVRFLEVVNDLLLFYGDAQQFPTSFMKSDGTAQGTSAFTAFEAGGPAHSPRDVTKIGDRVFYGDHEQGNDGYPVQPDHYYQLIQGDGYTRQLVRDIAMTSDENAYIGSDNIVDYNGLVLFTTQNNQASSTDLQKRLWIYDPNNLSSPQGTFTLVNADTDEDIQTVKSGDVIHLPEDLNINIRFNPVGTPQSVRFTNSGGNLRTETEAPYSVAGDKSGDYNTWPIGTANLNLTAWPYYIVNGERTLGTTVDLFLDVIREPAGGNCSASGTILREYWGWVPGNKVSDIPVNTNPNSVSQLTIFEGPTNSNTNYGARIRGYICPPATGDYTFWIASNDHSELWLSTDDNPSNRQRIAYISGATNPRQWDKFGTQKSAPINLTAGKRYYIEALHKQGVGTDNLAVGWQLPNGTMERPIPGNRLSPFQSGDNQPPYVLLTSPFNGQTFNQPVDITIEANASDPDHDPVTVEFFEGTNKLGEDLDAPWSFTWMDVPAGTYTITVKVTDSHGASTTSHPHTITVNEGTGGCTASGTITREYWSGVSGNRVSDIPVNQPPTSTNELTIFEGPSNIGTNYGTRIRGYICPPVSGGYNFYITSNDHSELWLSTDDDPANKVRIAYITGSTGPRDWQNSGSALAPTTFLEAGKRYYIEALHKQGVGSDHIAVGWTLPDGTMERPIPGNRLSPFEMGAAMASSSGLQVDMFSQLSVYPNPAQSGDAELSISGYNEIEQTIETQVEIINLTGEVIHAEKISCGGDCGTYLMNINKQLVPGVYLVNMNTNGLKVSKRLLVK